jgi:hypothetical protein
MTRIVCNNLAAPSMDLLSIYNRNPKQSALAALRNRVFRLSVQLDIAADPLCFPRHPKPTIKGIRWSQAQAEGMADIAARALLISTAMEGRYVLLFETISAEMESTVRSRGKRYSQFIIPTAYFADMKSQCHAMIRDFDQLIADAQLPGQTRLSGPPAERSEAGEERAADRDPVTGAEYGTPT